jgi:predicted O-methyltransferase YrrM
MMKKTFFLYVVVFSILILPLFHVFSQDRIADHSIDEKVEAFLTRNRYRWRDMNVPESDGRLLHDLIVQNNYRDALEIGTSTGHSAIWMAWALSKTGGKLITIEIDAYRYREALANFEEAGLSEFIDARLADAHELVRDLEGPFDFVFCDADKAWYKDYFIALYPKLKIGGCYTAHNVSDRWWIRGRTRRDGSSEFFEYIKGLDTMDTTLDTSGGGVSISYKRPSQ